ncbi:hypothetical protein D3C78_1934180 [compost metagenome]
MRLGLSTIERLKRSTRRRLAFTRAVSSIRLKGLVMYSSAPIVRPTTLSVSVPFAVSMMIGMIIS